MWTNSYIGIFFLLHVIVSLGSICRSETLNQRASTLLRLLIHVVKLPSRNVPTYLLFSKTWEYLLPYPPASGFKVCFLLIFVNSVSESAIPLLFISISLIPSEEALFSFKAGLFNCFGELLCTWYYVFLSLIPPSTTWSTWYSHFGKLRNALINWLAWDCSG